MTIDAKTTEEVLTHIQAISELLPRLITLTDESKDEMPDMESQKNLSFTGTAIELARANPDMLNGIVEIEDVESEWTSMKNLGVIKKQLEELLQKIADTAALSGYEPYMSALLFYKFVQKLANEGNSKALVIFDELHQHFPGRPKTISSTLSRKTNFFPDEKGKEENS
jgi:hypothetical protein